MFLFCSPETLQCSNPDVVSAADPEDLEKSEHQEPPAEQKQEEEVSGAEGVLVEASSDTVGF